VLAVIGSHVVLDVDDTAGEEAATQLGSAITLLGIIGKGQFFIDRDVRVDSIEGHTLYGIDTCIASWIFNLQIAQCQWQKLLDRLDRIANFLPSKGRITGLGPYG
jgi:hypothetical protein